MTPTVIGIGKGQTIDLAALDHEQRILLLYRLNEEIAAIEVQMKAAEDFRKIHGHHEDRRWYRNAQLAAKKKKAQRHLIQQFANKNSSNRSLQIEAARVYKEKLKAKKHETITSLFVDVAREQLPPFQFELILEEAKARQQDRKEVLKKSTN